MMAFSLAALIHSRKLRKVEERLSRGTSVLLEGPRHYGKESAVRALAATLRIRDGWTSIELSSQPALPARLFDPEMLTPVFVEQAGRRKRKSLSFDQTVWESVCTSSNKVLVLLRGGARGNEMNHSQLLGIFDRLLQRAQGKGNENLVVIALDDGSLSQKNETFIQPTDPYAFLKPTIRLGPLSQGEIVSCLANPSFGRPLVSDDERKRIARWLADATGGHPGLLEELFDAWPVSNATRNLRDLRPLFEEALNESAVLESLRRSLQDDPEGLSHTALEYEQPNFPEAHNPRLNVLCQIGILHRTSDSERLSLCGGAVARLVHSAAERNREPIRRVGSIVSESGIPQFLDTEVPIDNDTLVVVHLSDLHVGPEYRHAIKSTGVFVNSEERTLGDLIAEDLSRMELTNRVDALVLSGDFVGSGETWEQFQRAREVLEEVLQKTGIKRGQILMIPGNHDVNWKPGSLANIAEGRAISMDNYRDFAERLVGKRDPSILNVLSLSGNVSLRLIGLDSNHVEGPESGGIGYVSQGSFDAAQKALGPRETRVRAPKRDRTGRQPKCTHTWFVVHHHLFPIIDSTIAAARQRKVSVIGNASLLLINACRWGAELVLHGHAHQPAVTVARRWPTGTGREFASLPVVACGSIGAKVEALGPFARNQYWVIYRRKDDIILRSRCMDEAGVCFRADNDILLPRPGPAGTD